MKSEARRAIFGAIIVQCAGFLTGSAQASVQISAKPTQNMSCSAGVCSPSAKKAILNVNELAAMLADGDVAIESGSQAKDIVVNAAFSWTSNHALTLDANRSLLFQKAVVAAGTGSLSIITNDGGSGGDFRFTGKGHVEFWDTNSNLTINGDHYVLVHSIKQLAEYVRQNNSSNYALAKNFNAGRRIYGATPMTRTFAGNFDGLGNTISNLNLRGTGQNQDVGLFGDYSTSNDKKKSIRDLRLKSVNVIGSASAQHVGAVVGFMNAGSIVNVQVSGTVSANGTGSMVGGVVGLSVFSTVRASSSEASVTASNGAVAAGGLIGEDKDSCGSCIGFLDSNYATGTVSGGDGAAVGGLIGENLGAALSNSYATGAVSGGNNAFAGGLIGTNADSDLNGHPSVTTSYSVGVVSGGLDATVGGLLGQDLSAPAISDAYWDMDTSGISDPSKGAGNISNDPGITGLTTSQFKSALPNGFDPKIWKEQISTNNGYPFLEASTPN